MQSPWWCWCCAPEHPYAALDPAIQRRIDKIEALIADSGVHEFIKIARDETLFNRPFDSDAIYALAVRVNSEMDVLDQLVASHEAVVEASGRHPLLVDAYRAAFDALIGANKAYERLVAHTRAAQRTVGMAVSSRPDLEGTLASLNHLATNLSYIRGLQQGYINPYARQ